MTTDPRIEAAAVAIASKVHTRDFDVMARAALAAADNAATITTVEELDVLPSESVIRSEQGGVWERCDDGEVRYWITTGNSDEVFNSSQIALPARVTHWGTE